MRVTTFTVDVWHCAEDDRPLRKADWRRYVVSARDATDAELVACEMAFAHHGHAVESVVIDW
jgi:hypothetical protein